MPEERGNCFTDVLYEGVLYEFSLQHIRMSGGFEYWMLAINLPGEQPSLHETHRLLAGPLHLFFVRTVSELVSDHERQIPGWFTRRKGKRAVSAGIRTVLRDQGPKWRKRWGHVQWNGKWECE